jgi:hypothetical protein
MKGKEGKATGELMALLEQVSEMALALALPLLCARAVRHDS